MLSRCLALLGTSLLLLGGCADQGRREYLELAELFDRWVGEPAR